MNKTVDDRRDRAGARRRLDRRRRRSPSRPRARRSRTRPRRPATRWSGPPTRPARSSHKAADKTESKVEQHGRTRPSPRWTRPRTRSSPTWDKTKDKTREMKDKVKAKTTDKMDAKTEKRRREVDAAGAQGQGLRPGSGRRRHGPAHESGAHDYQKKEGLTPTGRWDDETATKLGVRTSARRTHAVAIRPRRSGRRGVPPATPDGTSTRRPGRGRPRRLQAQRA